MIHVSEKIFSFARYSLMCALMVPWLLSCDTPCDGPRQSFVLREIKFTDYDEDGFLDGIDVDRRVSAIGDETSCGYGDATAPDGRAGIDNRIAGLLPSIALFGGDPEALIQGSINEGRLLLMVELEGVDDLQNDDCVHAYVHTGDARPDIGTDGLILPGQSFDILDPVLSADAGETSIRDGIIETQAFNFQIQISILDANFTLDVKRARARMTIAEDGSVEGVLGGAVSVQELYDVITGGLTVSAGIAQLVGSTIRDSADISPDSEGRCQELSVALSFRGVSAFVLKESDAQ